MHFLHHLIAAIDAGSAADALILQAIADIDAGRADLHTDAAIDTIAEAVISRLHRARSPATRFAAAAVVGDDHGVLVEHGALKAGIGTHVLADLLAHPAGVAIGGKTVEQHPEPFPWAKAPTGELTQQLLHRCEIADKREAGP